MVVPIARWGLQFDVATGGSTPIAPRVAAIGPTGSATGRFVIVWAQSADVFGLGDDRAIVGQRYNSDGTPEGALFLINSTTAGVQDTPDLVERVDDEGFVVAWRDESRVPLGFGADVRMRFFDANGNPDSLDFIAHSAGRMNNETAPSIDRIGTFGTVFLGYDNLSPPPVEAGDINTGVRGRVFSNSTALGADFPVTTADPHTGENDFQAQVNVADLPTTGFLVTWTDNLAGGVSFDVGTAIRARLYSQLGAPIGEEFTVVSTPTAKLINPSGVGLPDGKFVVAWSQDDDPSAAFDYNVFARIFDGPGSPGAIFRLSTSTATSQRFVALEAFGTDRFIAAWTEDTGLANTIHARIFNNDGTAWSEEVIVNSDIVAPLERFPSIAVLQEATGPRFVITWMGNGVVRAQVFDPVAGALNNADFSGSERSETYTVQYDEHVLFGNGGNDNLTGSTTIDTLDGGTGNDTLGGGRGNDTLRGQNGTDALKGEDGADTLDGGRGNDLLDGGLGTDAASYASAGSAVVVNLALAGTQNTQGGGFDTLLSIEGLRGSRFADTLRGNDGVNSIAGGDGDDTINGGNGRDTLSGEVGNDRVFGSGGDDTETGGTGLDSLVGDAGNDTMNGGADNDRLFGGTGDDTLSGGAEHDFLDGGPGMDRIIGDTGSDRLQGRTLADTFVFAGRGSGADRVIDMEDNVDTLEISRGYGFATAAAVVGATSQSGNDALIALGGGDSIRLLGFLAPGAGNVINDLLNDIVVV